MKLLVVTTDGMFPNEASPSAGIFFANMLARLRPMVERIVAVTPTAYIPGPLRSFSRFSSRRPLARHGWWRGIEVFRPSYLSPGGMRHAWFLSRSFCLATFPLCNTLHRRFGFDVILACGLSAPSHTAQYIAKALSLPAVCCAVGTDVHTLPHLSRENASLFRHNVRYSPMILTDSDALRQMILKAYPWARHVQTFYRGTDLDQLKGQVHRKSLRARLGLSPNRTYMLSAGHVVPAKGTEEFYEAFKRLSANRPELAAMWIGGGSSASQLRSRAKADNLAERFVLTGAVPRSTLLEYMQATDLLAFPSHAEGLPNVVIEAVAAGLPTVATDVGGTREMIADGITGLLVPPRDVPQLVAAVDCILSSPQRAAKMARKGRSYAMKYFDAEQNAQVLHSILEHIRSGGSPTQPMPACAGAQPGLLPIDTLRASQDQEQT